MTQGFSICAIVRDEVRYLLEWISYHRTIGIQNFFIYDNVANDSRFLIDKDGKVGISCTPPANWQQGGVQYKLYVENGIVTRDILVTAQTFPDYVFEENYNLKSIAEYENFILKNKRLPGLPSAEKVKENGIEVGQLSTSILEKVEEQALYIIQLQSQINELNKKIDKIVIKN